VSSNDLDPVTLVVAGALDQRTGGYLYDARIVEGLRARGREVRVVELPGDWPEPASDAVDAFRSALAEQPDDAIVVVDGLVGGAAPDPIADEADRLCLVALVHHLLADEGDRPEAEVTELEARERRTLEAARRVIVTSEFTRDRVVELGADPLRVEVVEPGTDRPTGRPRAATAQPPSAAARSPDEEGRPVTLLCLGSVVPRKDQEGLVRALIAVHEDAPGISWRLDVVGSLERDRSYADRVRAMVADSSIVDRTRFAGEVGKDALEEIWAEADVLVSASRYEGYGMALTEAMVRGLPVVAVAGGAVERTVPADVGLLVPGGDEAALRAALHRVLADGAYRARLAARSLEYGGSLPTWAGQAEAFDTVLHDVLHAREIPHE